MTWKVSLKTFKDVLESFWPLVAFGDLLGPYGIFQDIFGTFLDIFGTFWVIIGHFGIFLRHFGTFRDVLVQFGTFLGHFWSFWNLLFPLLVTLYYLCAVLRHLGPFEILWKWNILCSKLYFQIQNFKNLKVRIANQILILIVFILIYNHSLIIIVIIIRVERFSNRGSQSLV